MLVRSEHCKANNAYAFAAGAVPWGPDPSGWVGRETPHLSLFPTPDAFDASAHCSDTNYHKLVVSVDISDKKRS